LILEVVGAFVVDEITTTDQSYARKYGPYEFREWVLGFNNPRQTMNCRGKNELEKSRFNLPPGACSVV